MRNNNGTLSSTCGNVNDVIGGRKTIESRYTLVESIAACEGREGGAVLIDMGRDDAVVFSDEVVDSVPFVTETESDDEEEGDWDRDEESDEEEDAEDLALNEGLAERLRILADARALKTLAGAFLHPEQPVAATAGTAFGRNYFNRYSAPETEDDDLADERAENLDEAAALKKLATDYLHPELGVTATDATLFGRNYFHRPSAPEIEEVEDADEHARVLADALTLKMSAMDYMHPEVGVATTDAACGRNYFYRYSAVETSDCEDEVASVNAKDARLWFADERAEVLAEVAALKQVAVDYMHPEVGVTATDGIVFGRNYFNRPSAPKVESSEEADEHALVLAEAAALKRSAVDYMHPEAGVTSAAGVCFGRNYFNRYSAPKTEDDDLADELAEIMAEAAALKKFAMDYMHPEVGVTATDATLFGRNYFHRPSAPEIKEVEDADEHARVLADALTLKMSAMDYMHPEVGVANTDAACGRNYFNRYSAAETSDCEDEVASVNAEDARLWFADERAEVLAEVAALKQVAVDYMHPEVGITATDGIVFGRNYFNRPSAPKVESSEEADEHALVLAEAAALKRSAVDYMHPEAGVTSAAGVCFGRNYFNRYSSPETEDNDLADERAEIMAEAAALKKSAMDYMHPEVGVTATDATLFGRNFFNRCSAPEVEQQARSPEESQYITAVKTLAAAVKGANLSANKSTKFNSSDQEDGEPKKSASTVNLYGLLQGVF